MQEIRHRMSQEGKWARPQMRSAYFMVPSFGEYGFVSTTNERLLRGQHKPEQSHLSFEQVV
jgi:hypothetical protein